MNLNQIQTVAHKEMAHRRDIETREPGWSYYHGKRTGKIAMHLARTLDCDADADTLLVAGLFHDVGKGNKRNNEVGAAMTRELLAEFVSNEHLDTICEIVRCHCLRTKSGDNSNGFSEATKLIQDADLIDHVGHIDIWLGFYWGGHHGQSIADRIAWYSGGEAKRWHRYMRDHLNYDVSRQMLEERIQLEDRFYQEFHRIYTEGV